MSDPEPTLMKPVILNLWRETITLMDHISQKASSYKSYIGNLAIQSFRSRQIEDRAVFPEFPQINELYENNLRRTFASLPLFSLSIDPSTVTWLEQAKGTKSIRSTSDGLRRVIGFEMPGLAVLEVVELHKLAVELEIPILRSHSVVCNEETD